MGLLGAVRRARAAVSCCSPTAACWGRAGAGRSWLTAVGDGRLRGRRGAAAGPDGGRRRRGHRRTRSASPGAGRCSTRSRHVAASLALLSIVLGALVARAAGCRRARGVERLQLKWFAAAALLFARRPASAAFIAVPATTTSSSELLIVDRTRADPGRRRRRDPALPALRHRRRDQPRAGLRRADRDARRDVPGAGAAGRAGGRPLGLRGRGLDAGRRGAVPAGARAHPGCGRPALLPPPLRRGADARGVRGAAARRGRPRGAGRRLRGVVARDGPARPRLAVARRSDDAAPVGDLAASTVALFVAIVPSALDDGAGAVPRYMLFVLAFATVGALVASRRPRNPIGWLLLLRRLQLRDRRPERDRRAQRRRAALVAWVGEWIWMVGIGPVGDVRPPAVPDGHLPSPRWRPVAWLAAAGAGRLDCGAVAFKPGRFEDSTIENPLGRGDPVAARLRRGTAALALLLAALRRLDRLPGRPLPRRRRARAHAAEVAALRGGDRRRGRRRSRRRSRPCSATGRRLTNVVHHADARHRRRSRWASRSCATASTTSTS